MPTMTQILDALDAEAAENLSVPLADLQHMIEHGSVWKMSLIISAALSFDPLVQYRAQKVYRSYRLLLGRAPL